jgi:hypothetical protein
MKNPGWLPLKGGWSTSLGASKDALGTWIPTISAGEFAVLRPGLTAGLALRNLGTPDDGILLQMGLAAGAAWRPVKSVTSQAELKYGLGDGLYHAGIGVEWNPAGMASLQVGYRLKSDNSGEVGLSSPTAGPGVRWKLLGANYAWEPMGDLGALSVNAVRLRLRHPGRA